MPVSFNNVGQWASTFNNDAYQPHRFITRFILIRGQEAWKETISFLSMEIPRQIRLSDWCSDQDTAPYLNIERIREFLTKYPAEKVLLYPMAELLRFGVTQPELIGQLAQLEGNRKTRLYIPLFEIEDIFYLAVESLARYSAGELAPFSRIDGNQEVKLTVSPLKFFPNETAMVDGFRDYLRLWEEGGACNVALSARLSGKCLPAVGRFEVTVYRDAFGILKNELESHLDETWGSPDEWEWLLSQIGNDRSVEKFAAGRFNLLDFDGHKLLMDWRRHDDKTRWLVWLWGKISDREDELLLAVIRSSRDQEALIEDLYNVVFSKDLSLDELRERRELLRIVSVKTAPKSFLDQLEQIQAPVRKLACLTGLNPEEKQIAITCVSDLVSGKTDPAFWAPCLEIVFPELSYYIQNVVYQDKLLESYFANYSRSRVVNVVSDELRTLTEKAARNKHYFVFGTRLSVLEKHHEHHESIVWFDGLGLEWLGLIRGVVSGYKDVRMDFRVARTNLPSVTETNMTDDDSAPKYRELDKMAHSYDYSFPESFAKEIEYVSSSIRKIIDGIAPGASIVITSDHGLTPASFNTETIKGLSDAKPRHWGRDAEYEAPCDGSIVNEDLFIYEGARFFLAMHGRLSGGTGCHGQIHGGATLEEALVPIIRLTRMAQAKDTLLIQPPEVIDHEIRLDRRGGGSLRIRVFGAPETVHVRIGLNTLEAKYCNENIWEVKLEGMPPGKIEAHVEQDGGYAGTIRFEATKGIKEVDLGL